MWCFQLMYWSHSVCVVTGGQRWSKALNVNSGEKHTHYTRTFENVQECAPHLLLHVVFRNFLWNSFKTDQVSHYFHHSVPWCFASATTETVKTQNPPLWRLWFLPAFCWSPADLKIQSCLSEQRQVQSLVSGSYFFIQSRSRQGASIDLYNRCLCGFLWGGAVDIQGLRL